jgi:hypothetical protein
MRRQSTTAPGWPDTQSALQRHLARTGDDMDMGGPGEDAPKPRGGRDDDDEEDEEDGAVGPLGRGSGGEDDSDSEPAPNRGKGKSSGGRRPSSLPEPGGTKGPTKPAPRSKPPTKPTASSQSPATPATIAREPTGEGRAPAAQTQLTTGRSAQQLAAANELERIEADNMARLAAQGQPFKPYRPKGGSFIDNRPVDVSQKDVRTGEKAIKTMLAVWGLCSFSIV